ncbi:hypothetical protein GCM10010912_26100 [Paenibacillus albidus]|uniref:Helix-turn-helix domain-containing protein n=1 Tax=Paenibacillus albidus TaxID=2041023 RepID=A0A917C9J7_9BACL|nr:AraC family transcriptional regulator [Paenibacillus albidus]GGF79885.1 hypothetical protein GCM10010912_26100 [Paenibacillus albidus]
MKLQDHILLWNHASIQILDIRHTSLTTGEYSPSYRLPASGFLFTTRGRARVMLDGIPYDSSGFHVLHGGKGMSLELRPEQDEALEFYLILYKAFLSLPKHKDLIKRHDNPFHIQYGLVPVNPAFLFKQTEMMYTAWRSKGELQQLQIKSLFYPWIYEVLRQLDAQGIKQVKPNLINQAVRYMHDYYNEPITLEQLSEALDSSPRTITRLFKRHLNTSPTQYLIGLRMEKAKALLLHTEATLQEIAVSIGYPDAYYFGRMFKKHSGTSPVRYKNEARILSEWPEMPSSIAGFDIVPAELLRYIDCDNHYQYTYKGESFMYRSTKPSLLLTLMLCFTIMLSACSTGAANMNTAGSSPSAPAVSPSAAVNAAAVTDNATADAEIRTISTVKGEIEVPANPQRVVVLYLLGDVLALGIKPIGVSDVYEGAAFEEELKDVQKLGAWFEASPEAVLALNPDLIIVASEETYETLHQIAPTVLVPYGEMSAEERVSFIGQIVGKEQEADKLFADFHAKVEESKQKLQNAGIYNKTVSIMEGGKDRSMVVVNSKQFGRGSQVIYEYLGMKAPEIVQQKIEVSTGADAPESVSFEVLADYSGDYIFRSSYTGMADLSADPLWTGIPAVQEGHLINLDFGLSYYSDIYSMDAQLDYIVDSLLATVK